MSDPHELVYFFMKSDTKLAPRSVKISSGTDSLEKI